MSGAMKRSIIFWPVMSALAVFMCWVGLLLAVVGVPNADGSESRHSRPAKRLVGEGLLYRGMASCIEVPVGRLWDFLPYCEPPSRPVGDRYYLHPHSLWPRKVHTTSGRVSVGPYLTGSVAQAREEGWSTGLVMLRPLVRWELLVYVVLISGAHFALTAFVLVGAVTVLTRVLIRPTPEGVAAPPRGKQEGAQP